MLLQLTSKIENKRIVTICVLTNQWNSINFWLIFTKLNKTSKPRCQWINLMEYVPSNSLNNCFIFRLTIHSVLKFLENFRKHVGSLKKVQIHWAPKYIIIIRMNLFLSSFSSFIGRQLSVKPEIIQWVFFFTSIVEFNKLSYKISIYN